MKVSYVTSNPGKFENAKKFFAPYNIEVEQLALKVEEIQSSDSIEIATAKAQSAYNIKKLPLFVNDASWIIPSLKGFPGPFMKYMNQWFEPRDFINLMKDKTDRRIILRDSIVYIDETGYKIFTHDHEGIFLEDVSPFEYQNPSEVVISLSKNHKSIAEEKKNGSSFIEDEDLVWKQFASWLQDKPQVV